MAREAKIVIASENKAGTGIKSAEEDLRGFQQVASKVGDTLKTAFPIIGLVELTKKLGEFGQESIKAFGDFERRMNQLKASVDGNQESFTKLTGVIANLARKTTESKDSVEHLVAELASIGKSDADIERIASAVVNLSNVTGKGLNESLTQVLGTYKGSTDELGKLVPEVMRLSKEQLTAGNAVDILNKKFGEISDRMANGVTQKIKNMGGTWGDFTQAIGQDLAPAFSPMLDWISKVVQRWTDAINEHNRYQEALRQTEEGPTTQDKVSGMLEQWRIKLEQSQVVFESFKREAGLDSFQSYLAKHPGMEASRAASSYGSELASFNKSEWAQDLARAQQNVANLTKLLGTLGVSTGERKPAPVVLTDESGNPIDQGGYTAPTLGGPVRNAGYEDALFPSETIVGYGRDGIPIPANLPGASDLARGRGGMASSGAGSPLDGILSGLANAFSPLLEMFKSLGSLQAVLNPLQTIFQSMMDVLGPLINEALAPLVGILKIIGQALGAVLAPVVKFLGEVIKTIAQGILWVWNGIVDAINAVLGWAGVHLSHASLSDAIATGETAYPATGGGASYTGAQSITINFYNQGNVVGSGGMQELAGILADLLAQRARYA